MPAGPPAVPAVVMRDVVKRYGDVLALDGARLEARAGEVHGVLGENGAGKSTLLAILAGLRRPDAGEMALDGVPFRPHTPRDAWQRGVGMVHQHFALIPRLTVLENLALGHRRRGGFGLPTRRIRARALELERRTGLNVPLERPVEELGVGHRQRAEILKVLLRDPAVLALDEPTAVLSPPEVRRLSELLRALAAEGRAVLLVAHKLDEVLEVADRVTVLRQGRTVLEAPRSEVDADALARAMVGVGEGKSMLAPVASRALHEQRGGEMTPEPRAAPHPGGADPAAGGQADPAADLEPAADGAREAADEGAREAAADLQPADDGVREAAADLQPADEEARDPAADLQPADEGAREPAVDLQPADEGAREAAADLQSADDGVREAAIDPDPADDEAPEAAADLQPAADGAREAAARRGSVARLSRVGLGEEGGPGGHILQDVDLEVRRGEIVGIAGVEGNGQRELALVLAGRLAPDRGQVEVPPEPGFVPQDRSREGLVSSFTLTENLALALHRDGAMRRGPALRWGRIRERTVAAMARYGVRAPGPEARAATLSGGNQQRVVVARELEVGRDLLVAENPTRGLDVAAAAFVRGQLRELVGRHDAPGVVLLSTDLDEILELSDRVLVMVRGRLITVPDDRRTRDGVGRLMLGVGGES